MFFRLWVLAPLIRMVSTLAAFVWLNLIQPDNIRDDSHESNRVLYSAEKTAVQALFY